MCSLDWWIIMLYRSHHLCFHAGPLTVSPPLLSPPILNNFHLLPLHCLWQISPSLLPLLPFLSHTLRFLRWSLNILPPPLFCLLSVSLLLSFLPVSFSLSLSPPLPGVVSVARALLFLTATALTSMTFFSCLVRHQTPALGEATLLHRRRAAAKLCTGTARQWSRTVSGRRWGGGDGGGGRGGRMMGGRLTYYKLHRYSIKCSDN